MKLFFSMIILGTFLVTVQSCYYDKEDLLYGTQNAVCTYAADKAIGQNGSLYGSISYATGYSPMPKGMSKMTSCQIATIKKWVDSGMPNN